MSTHHPSPTQQTNKEANMLTNTRDGMDTTGRADKGRRLRDGRRDGRTTATIGRTTGRGKRRRGGHDGTDTTEGTTISWCYIKTKTMTTHPRQQSLTGEHICPDNNIMSTLWARSVNETTQSCSLHVSFMITSCPSLVPFMFPSCSLQVPPCSTHVPFMFPSRPFKFRCCSLHAPPMPLNVPPCPRLVPAISPPCPAMSPPCPPTYLATPWQDFNQKRWIL